MLSMVYKFLSSSAYLFCVCFVATSTLKAQTNIFFPESHFGTWFGKLELYTSRNLEDTLSITFSLADIGKKDTFSYQLCYHTKEGNDLRDYHLIRVTPTQFVIDELNGILLSATLFNKKWCSSFRMDQTDIHFHFQLEDSFIVMEVFSNSNEPVSTSGGINGVPIVHSLRNYVYQRAVLYPVK
jgi:hypothetical protein